MRKGVCAVLALVCVMFLCAGCGGRETQPEVPMPEGNQAADYSGLYTDKQGTGDIYSWLELLENKDGSYRLTLSIHRTAEMLGTAAEAGGGRLHFDCYAPDLHVGGGIVIAGDTAEATVTESDFSGMAVGTVYRFPDGRE